MKNMILRIPTSALLVLLFALLTACNSNNPDKNLPAGVHSVEVIQVIQTTKYTYLRVNEDKTEYWMAIVREEIKPGETIYYSQGYEMKEFYSKELDRTFASVLFVQDPSASPDKLAATGGAAMHEGGMSQRRQPVTRLENLSIKPAEGSISLGDLFKNRDLYNGKKVKVRGLVTKLSKQIMQKNWMHIQDGSIDGEMFDLTVTSTDIVTEGNIATFEGIIALKKDFGSGYFYEIILEEATPSDVELYE